MAGGRLAGNGCEEGMQLMLQGQVLRQCSGIMTVIMTESDGREHIWNVVAHICHASPTLPGCHNVAVVLQGICVGTGLSCCKDRLPQSVPTRGSLILFQMHMIWKG